MLVGTSPPLRNQRVITISYFLVSFCQSYTLYYIFPLVFYCAFHLYIYREAVFLQMAVKLTENVQLLQKCVASGHRLRTKSNWLQEKWFVPLIGIAQQSHEPIATSQTDVMKKSIFITNSYWLHGNTTKPTIQSLNVTTFGNIIVVRVV